MLTKVKHAQYLWRGSRLDFMNSTSESSRGSLIPQVFKDYFCSIAESCKLDFCEEAESPDLPDWIKFSAVEKPVKRLDEDDFVLPSAAYQKERCSIHVQQTDAKSSIGSMIGSDIHQITRILKKHFESPDDVIKALHGCSFHISEALVEQILRRFSCEWLPTVGFFKWVQLEGFQLSPVLYNQMFDNLGKSKKFDLMWGLIEEMNQWDGYVTAETFEKAIRRLAKAGRYNEVKEAARKMEKYGLQKDTSVMNSMMDALVKEGSVEHAEMVYLHFTDSIAPNLQTFNILMHGWCRAKKIDKAKATLGEMENLGFHPDLFTYTSLIKLYYQEKDFRKGEAILAEMEKKGCPPNVVTYTIIANALGKAKEVNKVLELYERMKQGGCLLDTSFYNILIFILGKAGRFKDSQYLFVNMSKDGLVPNGLTYNTMIKLAAESGRVKDALKLLQEMEDSQCMPDLETYASLLKMCCRMKRMNVLSFLLGHMIDHNVSIDLGTYSLLVRGLCRIEKHEEACSFFEKSVLRGFLPHDCIYQKLVKELEKKDMTKEKRRIEEFMSKAKAGAFQREKNVGTNKRDEGGLDLEC